MTKVKRIRLEQDVQDILDVIDTTGDGSKFLNDAGEYEEVGGGGLSDAQCLVDDTFMLGEDCTKGDSLFKEVGPTFSEADQEQNIGDVAGNTRVSFPVIGSGVAGNSLKLALAKSYDLGEDLTLRIETDNAGAPSGTLIDDNATATITRASLTTSLTDFSISIDTPQYTEKHLQTLDSVESAIVPHKGLKFTLKKQVGLVNIIKNSSCTATKCYLYDSKYNLIETKSFVGDTATFGYGDLIDGETYYVLAGSDTSTYNSVKQSGTTSFPYVGDSLDIERGFSRRLATDNGGEANMYGYWDRIDYPVGFRIKALEKINIDTVTKLSYTQADRAIIRNSGGTILATAFFSGNTATFDKGIIFEKNEQFIIEVWKGGAAYDAAIQNNRTANTKTNTEWLNGTNNGVDAGTTSRGVVGVGTTALIDEDNINNIESITTNENFLINEGQKVHIVLAQAGDEVDSDRYFKVGYSTNNTTTRPMSLFDGTDWGTADNDKFAYTSSDLFIDTLLSLTDATYTYKLPNDIVRFAKTNGAIGEKVKCSYLGIADLFTGLTTGSDYFLQDTPGTIGATAGTNPFLVINGISATKGLITSHSRYRAITGLSISSDGYTASQYFRYGGTLIGSGGRHYDDSIAFLQISYDNTNRTTIQEADLGDTSSYLSVPIPNNVYVRLGKSGNYYAYMTITGIIEKVI